MVDTQRSRAAILALMANNVTGEISAQDLRDFVVTIMEEEFRNVGDFWNQPDAKLTNTDGTMRGWSFNSQFAGEALSFMNVCLMDPSNGAWYLADAADSTLQGLLALAMNSFAANASQCSFLAKGIVYNSTFSTVFSRKLGMPVYLDSGIPGSISVGKPAQSASAELVRLGVVMPSTAFSITSMDSASGKWFFRPQWAVVG